MMVAPLLHLKGSLVAVLISTWFFETLPATTADAMYGPVKIWEDAIAKYDFEASSYNKYKADLLSKTIRLFESQSCIRFKRQKDQCTQGDCVLFTWFSDNICGSDYNVGKSGGQQIHEVGGCQSVENYQAALMNALGWSSEHLRSDRDRNVGVHLFKGKMTQDLSPRPTMQEDTKYCFNSVMHPPLNQPLMSEEETMFQLGSSFNWGQRRNGPFADCDLDRIRNVYCSKGMDRSKWVSDCQFQDGSTLKQGKEKLVFPYFYSCGATGQITTVGCADSQRQRVSIGTGFFDQSQQTFFMCTSANGNSQVQLKAEFCVSEQLGNVTVSTTVEKDEVIYRCPANGGGLEAIGCNSATTNRNGPGTHVAIGEEFEVIKGKYMIFKRCEAPRPKVVACQSPGGRIVITVQFDDDNLRKKCFHDGVQTIGCYPPGKFEWILVGQNHFVDQTQSLVLNCTKNGFVPMGCLDSSKNQIGFGSTSEVNGVISTCTDHGLEVTGCTTKTGLVPFGNRFKEDGFVWECRNSPPFKGKEACITFKAGEVNIGTTFIEDGFVHQCTENGPHKTACSSKNGKVVKFGDSFVEDGFRLSCEKMGIAEVACVSADGSEHPLGETFNIEGISKTCTVAGPEASGCVTDNSNSVVPFTNDPTQTFVHDGYVKLCSAGDHSVNIVGCISGTQTLELGRDFVENGVSIDCTDRGRIPRGCVSKSAKGASASDACAEGTICFGQTYDEEGFRMRCNKSGPEKIGCLLPSGASLGFAQYTVESGFRLACTEASGPVKIALVTGSGKEVPIGESFVENGVQFNATENGPIAHGCVHTSKVSAIVPIGNSFKDSGFVYNCSVKAGAVKSALIISNGSSIPIGQKFEDDGKLILEATKSGPVPVGCRAKSGTMALGASYLSPKYRKNCTTTGPVKVAYRRSNGDEVPIGQLFSEGGVLRKATTNGPQPVGCSANGNTTATIAFGQNFDAENFEQSCTEKGPEKLKYITESGDRVSIGQQFNEGGLVMNATDTGPIPIGCQSGKKGTGVVEFGQEFWRDKLRYGCTKSGARVNGCASTGKSGKVTVPLGQTFKKMGTILNCTVSGAQALGCSSKQGLVPFGKRYQKHDMLKECTPTASLTVGCLPDNGHQNKHNTQQSSAIVDIGQTFVHWDFVRNCTRKGPVSIGCSTAGGGVVSFNETFVEANLKKQCTRKGIQKLGCVTGVGTGTVVHIGANYTEHSIDKRCTAAGIVDLGCHTKQGTVKFGDTYVTRKGVKKVCKASGKGYLGCVVHGANSSSNTVAPIGTQYVQEGVLLNCTEHGGAQGIGCEMNGQRVQFGQHFNEKGFKKLCRKDQEPQVIACLSGTGSRSLEVQVGHQLDEDDDDFVYNCTEDGGLVKATCRLEKGKYPAFGSQFTDDDVWLQCSEDDGIMLLGCVSNGQKFGVFETQVDATSKVIRKCTDTGLLVIGCQDSAAANHSVGTEFNSGVMRKVCTPNGPLPMYCHSNGGLRKIGEQFEEDGFYKRCEETGTVIDGGRTKKRKPVPKLPSDFRKTIILLKRPSADAVENVFIQGGVSHKRRQGCGTFAGPNNPCSIPIQHLTSIPNGFQYYSEWSINDAYLDWYGAENTQGSHNTVKARGTPLVWSTNDKSKEGFQATNEEGAGYWLTELEIDCSKTDKDWFEFKAVAFFPQAGVFHVDYEGDVDQVTQCSGAVGGKPPFKSTNHVAKCGFTNIFEFNSNSCRIEKIR